MSYGKLLQAAKDRYDKAIAKYEKSPCADKQLSRACSDAWEVYKLIKATRPAVLDALAELMREVE